MSIFDKLKADNIQQRKNKDPFGGETTFLIANIKTAIKNKTKDGVVPEVTDDLVISEIRSYIKKTNQTLDLAGSNLSEEEKSKLENAIKKMGEYLPPELSDDQILSDIEEVLSKLNDRTPKVMGKAIGLLKAKYGTSFDGNKVSRLLKTKLGK